MPELPIAQSQRFHPADEEPVLVGFRLDAGHDGPQFYTVLAIGGPNERPIMSDGHIVFFARAELAGKALLLDNTMAHLKLPEDRVEMLCDFAQSFYLVNSADDDPDGIILDCLHVTDDVVRATRLNMPERYQGVLTELADHLSRGINLRGIFTNDALRHHVEDALMWCVGAVAMRARMVSE